MRVAIVHDYLTQRGGAERVVLALAATFPAAPIHTALFDPDRTFPELRHLDVRPLWTNRFSSLRRDHRRGLALYPLAFGARRVDADVVVCSSSAFAHGVRTTGRKLVYCYTPPRWLYDDAGSYLAAWSPGVRAIVRSVSPALRWWDRRAARSADRYLTTSRAVRDRIARVYGIDAHVVPPPVTIRSTTPRRPRDLPDDVREDGFLLVVSRLLAYKNVTEVARAFAELGDLRLVIVGDGPARDDVRRAAGANVTILPRVDDDELAWLYSGCTAVVSAAHEDFGLTPLEAAAHGRPSAVLRAGGFVETVVEATTGVFFDTTRPADIADGIRRAVGREWDRDLLVRHASGYSHEAFATRLADHVREIASR